MTGESPPPSGSNTGSTAHAASSAAQAYDDWYRSTGLLEQGCGAPWHDLALPHLPPSLEGREVLEIGCGRGGFSRLLAERGARVTAADISQVAVEAASMLLEPFQGSGAQVADLCELGFPDSAFDVVISLDTIEHVGDPDRALSELVRVLRPAGKLILTTSNYLGLMGVWRAATRVVGRRYTELGQPVNRLFLAYPRTSHLRRLGCRVEAVDGCGHYLRVPRYELGYLRLGFLEHPHWLTKWFAAHRLVVATKVSDVPMSVP